MIKNKKDKPTSWLQLATLRLARIHFLLTLAYSVILIASDAWGLITRELVWQRWAVAMVMLGVTTLVWYLAHGNMKSTTYYKVLIALLVVLDIALATFVVYTERGMASRGVALYALPIAVSAVMLNRSAVYGTAALCTATYVVAVTRYFFVFFNEGYKAELYTTLGFYSAGFFVLAAIMWVVMKAKFD